MVEEPFRHPAAPPRPSEAALEGATGEAVLGPQAFGMRRSVHEHDRPRDWLHGKRRQRSAGERLFLFGFLAFRLRNCGMLWKSAEVLIRQQISKRGKKGWQAGTGDKMANLETSSIVRKTHLETNQTVFGL